MKRYKASAEPGKPAAAGRSAACWLGVFAAISLALLQARPVSAQGSGLQKSIIGSAPADFTLPDVGGHPVRFSDFKGRIVLLAFWATWCPPCKEELPTLQKLYSQYHDKDLVILTVDDEEPATIKDFLGARHYGFQALVDSRRAVFREFAVHFIPTVFVINREGIVTRQLTGWEGPQRLLEALRAAGLGSVLPSPVQPANPGGLLRAMIVISKQETNT